MSVSDISAAALEVFRINCQNILAREIPHFESDLLAGVPGPFDMITANPPYITSAECREMMSSRWPEPELALNGGEDGLDIIRRLIVEAEGALTENGWLLVEASPPQADTISDIFIKRHWQARIIRDLAGRKRVVAGRR
jgi:release factor glutamine methyltransferase